MQRTVADLRPRVNPGDAQECYPESGNGFMADHHVAAGIALLVVTVLFIAWRYFRHPRRPLPARGWAGFGIVLLAEALLFLHSGWFISVYFTPIVWTGYILLVDGLVASLRGDSRISRSPGGFLALAFWSIPLWLIFEAYNLRLANWVYVGMPLSPLVDYLGYAWAFSTIWPGIYETADLLEALGFFAGRLRPRPPSSAGFRRLAALVGLLMVAVPVLVPARIGGYLFGPVWVGFILLLDPVLYAWNGESLLRDWECGLYTRLGCLLGAGWVCGILWEFWNYWAGARWLYVFPIGQGWKIFQMPAPGFAGFPPFAVECWVLFETLRTVRGRLTAASRQPELAHTRV
jgi:hypothetical protein